MIDDDQDDYHYSNESNDVYDDTRRSLLGDYHRRDQWNGYGASRTPNHDSHQSPSAANHNNNNIFSKNPENLKSEKKIVSMKSNCMKELNKYAESSNGVRLFREDVTFNESLKVILPEADQTSHSVPSNQSLILKINLSRPNMLAHGNGSGKDGVLPGQKLNFSLPTILAFLLHKLKKPQCYEKGSSNTLSNVKAKSDLLNSHINHSNSSTSHNKNKDRDSRHSNSVNSLSNSSYSELLNHKEAKPDLTCPFVLTGLQQVSISPDNTSSGKSPMIVCLIEPDTFANSPISQATNQSNNKISNDNRNNFIKKIKLWLNKYKIGDLFFSNLKHSYPPHFKRELSSMTSSGFGFGESTQNELLFKKRQDGIFDTCKILPINFEKEAKLCDVLELVDGNLSTSNSLKCVFEKQPSLISNPMPTGSSDISEPQPSLSNLNGNLGNWPVILSGFNLLTEPRILADFFAKIVFTLSCDLIGMRLIYTNRSEIDNECIKPGVRNYNPNGQDFDSVVPSLAVYLRGGKMLKMHIKNSLGNLSQHHTYDAYSNDVTNEMAMNVKYGNYLREDKSFFYTPINASKKWRAMAYFFGGRLKDLRTDGFNYDKFDNFPPGHDKLMDNIRAFYDPENFGEKHKPQAKKEEVMTKQEADPTTTTEESKGKKKKKRNKKKKAIEAEMDDIDALVNELQLDVCESTPSDDSMFYFGGW